MRIAIAAMTIMAPSNPAEKKAMRSYPYRKWPEAGRALRRRLNTANPTAIT
jgi:hypothetical protein